MGRCKRCPVEAVSIKEMDATKIAPRLYQGGLGEFDGCQIAIKDVNLVVKLTGDTDVSIIWPDVIEYDLEDLPDDLRHLPRLNALASKLARVIRKGAKVAIMCRQGRNRSGLLTGLVLRKLYKWPGYKIVDHIRQRRADALYGGGGEYFAAYLEQQYA